ncbi:hypothetical protein H0H93_000530 [Arthromyces matolae]|nr:hypothetical protein H0H93_000530 [Arthromyces matolae]
MAKRKTDVSDFIEDDSKSSKRAQKKRAVKEESDSDFVAKKEEEDDDELEASEQDEPLSIKKPKFEAKCLSKDGDVVKTSSEGDKYIDLGKKKRATVRTFKGMTLLDIREFYGNEGDEKPGKKGISLTSEQWETLKSNTDTLDKLFAAVSSPKKK